MQPGEEQGVREAGGGDLVAEGARDALDEPVLAQAPEVIGHLPRGDGLGGHAEELRHDGAQIAVGEAAGKQPEHAQGREQGVDAGVAEAQARDAGPASGDQRCGELGDGDLAIGGVMAEFLDVQQTPGGRKAAARSAGRLSSRLPMPKSRASLIVVSVLSALPSLWYCFIFECL